MKITFVFLSLLVSSGAFGLKDNSDVFKKIGLYQAYEHFDFQEDLRPITLAVIDSGLNTSHPQLRGHLGVNFEEGVRPNGKDDDNNSYVDDLFGYDFINGTGQLSDPDGHGTHVAGLITQVNPKVKILGLRVLSSKGRGSPLFVSRAIFYAISRGAKVINLSLGAADALGSSEVYYHAAMKHARRNNTLVIASAGNNSSDNDKYGYFPANMWDDNIMAICSSDGRGKLSSFSNSGQWRVHLCAPGENLLSANASFRPQQGIWSTPPQQVYMSGTSQAAPLVSATAALLYGLKPDLKAYEARDLIMESTSLYPTLEGKSQTGGVLNIEGAVKSLLTK